MLPLGGKISRCAWRGCFWAQSLLWPLSLHANCFDYWRIIIKIWNQNVCSVIKIWNQKVFCFKIIWGPWSSLEVCISGYIFLSKRRRCCWHLDRDFICTPLTPPAHRIHLLVSGHSRNVKFQCTRSPPLWLFIPKHHVPWWCIFVSCFYTFGGVWYACHCTHVEVGGQ